MSSSRVQICPVMLGDEDIAHANFAGNLSVNSSPELAPAGRFGLGCAVDHQILIAAVESAVHELAGNGGDGRGNVYQFQRGTTAEGLGADGGDAFFHGDLLQGSVILESTRGDLGDIAGNHQGLHGRIHGCPEQIFTVCFPVGRLKCFAGVIVIPGGIPARGRREGAAGDGHIAVATVKSMGTDGGDGFGNGHRS